MKQLSQAGGKIACRLEVYFGLVAKDFVPTLDPSTARRAAAQGLEVAVHRTYPFTGGAQES